MPNIKIWVPSSFPHYFLYFPQMDTNGPNIASQCFQNDFGKSLKISNEALGCRGD